MPFHQLRIQGGVNVQETPALNSTGYAQGSNVRFRAGVPEKRGGYQHISTTPLVGTCTGVHVWDDLVGNPYMACGTDQRLEVFSGGTISDITPNRATHNVAVQLTTVNHSTSVTIHDVAHGAAAGDWIYVVVPIAIGGLIIQGYYLVQSVIDANNYTITAASAATSSAGPGGAVPVFDTTNTLTPIQVTMAAHGLTVGSVFTVQVSTTVGGIVINGVFSVIAPVTANTFTIDAGVAASSTATGSENAGNARYWYLIPSGSSSAMVTSGYGAGDYGAGDYGLANPGSINIPLRQWFLDNYGQDLIGNYTNGPAYYWVPPVPAPASLVNGSPTAMTASFVTMPAAIFVALGAEVGGTQDPNLIRWTDAGGDPSTFNWTASSTNQAGSFRIPTGSRIVGGAQFPQHALIWTDIDLWSMEYVGPPFVFSFNKIAGECGLIAGRAHGLIGQSIVWMSTKNFFIMDGQGFRPLPSTVWDEVFKNLNSQQNDKIHCAVNSLFNEVSWRYPSASGTGAVDSQVTINALENLWDYSSTTETAWADESDLGEPIGVDSSGILQQHDVAGVYDADGQPLDAFWQTGYATVQDGTFMALLERMIPDFVWQPYPGGAIPMNAQATLTVYMTDYPGPNIPIRTYGPYTITPTTSYVIVRGRGRYAAIKVEVNGLGVFLRQGAVLHNAAPAGKRP